MYKVQINVGGSEWLDLGHAEATLSASHALIDYDYALRIMKPEVAVRLVRLLDGGAVSVVRESVSMAAGRDVPVAQLQRIAQKAGFDAGVNVGSDRDDFRQISAATMLDLLERAYLLGRNRSR